MSGLKVFWATIKGWICPGTSAFEEIAKIALNQVNSALTTSLPRVEKICSKVTSALEVLDKYAGWCPVLWKADFDRIRSLIAQIAGMIGDGAVSTEEVQKIADLFRIEYARWFAD